MLRNPGVSHQGLDVGLPRTADYEGISIVRAARPQQLHDVPFIVRVGAGSAPGLPYGEALLFSIFLERFAPLLQGLVQGEFAVV